MGGFFFAGAVRGPEIGYIRPPDRHRILRPSPGAGEIGGFNERPFVGQHLAVGGRDGFFGTVNGFLGTAGGKIVLRRAIALAAGRIGADIRLRVLTVAPGTAEGIGPSHHRLGLLGLRLKIRRDLPKQDPGEIFVQVHFHNLPILQHFQRPGCGLRWGGGSLRCSRGCNFRGRTGAFLPGGSHRPGQRQSQHQRQQDFLPIFPHKLPSRQ